jgi:hypothetical protein
MPHLSPLTLTAAEQRALLAGSAGLSARQPSHHRMSKNFTTFAPDGPTARAKLSVPPKNPVATLPSSIRPINLAVRRLPAATPGLGRCLPPW